MSVDLLSQEQVSAYVRFAGPPSQGELERFFFLDDVDRALVEKRQGDCCELAWWCSRSGAAVFMK